MRTQNAHLLNGYRTSAPAVLHSRSGRKWILKFSKRFRVVEEQRNSIIHFRKYKSIIQTTRSGKLHFIETSNWYMEYPLGARSCLLTNKEFYLGMYWNPKQRNETAETNDWNKRNDRNEQNYK